jgi:hypothetical protein
MDYEIEGAFAFGTGVTRLGTFEIELERFTTSYSVNYRFLVRTRAQ